MRNKGLEVEMGKRIKLSLLAGLLIMSLASAGCDVLMAEKSDGLKASGVVEVVEVVISSEIGGRVVEVFVREGDRVGEDDPLFKLDDELLDTQKRQAVAALEAAQANLQAAQAGRDLADATRHAAQAGVDLAMFQYELELATARLEDQPARIEAWDRDVPNEFDMPVWYFEKSETIAAARVQLQAAQDALEIERANYERVLQDASNEDLRAAEARLSEAQAEFLIADALLDRDIDWRGRSEVKDYIDTIYDAAEAELESAQKAYDRILTEKAAENVLEARARVIVAQERYETALDLLHGYFTGSDSLQVQAAEAALRQAEALALQAEASRNQVEAGVVQAEKAVAQAKAALDAVELQLSKLTVTSPIAGVVMTRNVEPGEAIQPGVTAMTVGQMDQLTITVYIPEDRYGQIGLGDPAQVTADSFPDEVFEAVVTRIADQAEYTPRNVQTEEDRRTTVYAVELSVDDPTGKLKPGMPADVVFGE
jgi:HlyD family secretion protein